MLYKILKKPTISCNKSFIAQSFRHLSVSNEEILPSNALPQKNILHEPVTDNLSSLASAQSQIEIPSSVIEHHIGDLSALGLCKWNPSGLCQSILEVIHVTTGLPWWITIAIASVSFRLALFPLFMEQARKGAKMASISPKLKTLQEEVKEARKIRNLDIIRQKTRDMQILFQNNGISPFSTLKFPMISGFIMMSFYFGIQGMCNLPVPSFKSGGFGGFLDLASPDPYFLILPVINAALVQLNFKLGSDTGVQNTTLAQNTRRIFSAIIWMMPLLTYKFQVAVFSYWIPTQFFAVFQGLLLRNPNFRARFNLPSLDNLSSAQLNETTKHKTTFMQDIKGFFSSIKESAESKLLDEKKKNDLEVKNKIKQRKRLAQIGKIENIKRKQMNRFENQKN